MPAGVYKIGVIADVQYANIDNQWNFMKTSRRRYRGCLESLRKAVAEWNSMDLKFVADLGDAIDGNRNETREDGEKSLLAVMEEWSALGTLPVVRCVGNHELYKFTREELTAGITLREKIEFTCAAPRGIEADATDRLYYTFELGHKWRVVVIDGYDASMITKGGGRPGVELTVENGGLHREWTELCQRNNPNNVVKAGNFFEGLTPSQSRWCPFNGALGTDQLRWLDETLQKSAAVGESVLVLTHIVVHPLATPNEDGRTVLWNCDEVLGIFTKHKCVKLVLAGHAHHDGYYFDPGSRTHHWTVPSPLEAPEDKEDTFGVLELDTVRQKAIITGSGLFINRQLDLSL